MSAEDRDGIRQFWDAVADDWLIQVGDAGDRNRFLNSDPVLRRLLGDVQGRRVLDAGCGTGYLSAKLRDAGAAVTGIDLSPRMIEIARERYAGIEFRVDSCETLAGLGDEVFDALAANYVLMDLADVAAAVRSFHRVLRPGGIAVAVFSHPCFPQGRAATSPRGGTTYEWEFPYFEQTKRVDPPWAHFKSEFVWYHRPLSAYWRAFRDAGFAVTEMEEPRLPPDRYDLAKSAKEFAKNSSRPYSIAFQLRKAA